MIIDEQNPSTPQDDYRRSHTAPGKGSAYDLMYEQDRWERHLWRTERRVLARILDEWLPNREIHLLDFACGTGRLSGFLESRVTSAVGVDVSEVMLEEARAKLEHTQIIQADLTREDVLRGRRFNLITAFRFFLNAEPSLREKALASLVALLDENGIVVFNNHHNSRSLYVTLLKARRWGRLSEKFKVMSMADMKLLAKRAGLEIVRIYPVGFLHLPKIPLPQWLVAAAEATASACGWLRGFSESPIVVCRLRKSHTPKPTSRKEARVGAS